MTSQFSRTALAALAACILCLAAPALASAASFQVDSSGDQPDSIPGDGSCQTAVATCTLRAAIEEANAEASADVVTFAAGFDGGASSTITPATALPSITQPLMMNGGRCTGTTGVSGPCVGIAAPTGERGLVAAADDVAFEGLSITGATVAVTVEDGSDRAKVAGNWLGLGLDGTPAANGRGVLVGSAAGVTIGGGVPQASNRLNGGSTGIATGPAAVDLVIEGNLIGLNLTGSALLAPPSEFAIDDVANYEIAGDDVTRIAANRIAMLGGEAIRQHGNGALIVANTIGQTAAGLPLSGGANAIHLEGAHSVASVVAGNTIANAGQFGLLIENGDNRVIANRFLSAGLNGIRVADPAPLSARGNLIGEDAPSTENVISGSGGAAIVIVDWPISGNLVARVSGSGNGGLFIDRGGNGPGNPGEKTSAGGKGDVRLAIGAPKIDSATPTQVSGTTTVPGALIRVYSKATSSPGELGSMIAEGVSTDRWSLSYPPQPAGSYVAVTASSYLYGTSELAIASTDGKPPRARILAGPHGRTAKRWAKFRFRSTEAGSTFVCQLDRRPWRSCRSPRIYRHLKPGFHTFRVRAKDAAGNVQVRPTVRHFKVVKHRR